MAMASLAGTAAVASADFGFVPGSFSAVAENSNGTIDSLAGSHPYAYTVNFAFDVNQAGELEGGEARDIALDLPPGFVGDPLAVPRCTQAQFEGVFANCPTDTQVGVLRAVLPGIGRTVLPVFNIEPIAGIPAQIGASGVNLNVLQKASVRGSDEGYGLTVAALDVPNAVSAVTETVWGEPSDSSHDSERGLNALDGAPPVSSEAPPLPFLTLPTSCAGPQQLSVRADSKLLPGVFVEEAAQSLDSGGNPAALVGCETVPFQPAVLSTPTSRQAEGSTGLDFELKLPDQGLLDRTRSPKRSPRRPKWSCPKA